jgi:carbon starvation protein
VGAWGYILYVGVTDPLGGINQLFPLFGIANQLLAAIALTLCTTLLVKHGRLRWVWVTAVPLAWVLVATMTASFQKVFSGDPAVGYFAQRARYAEAVERGEVLAPAADLDAMAKVVTNSTVNGVLQSVFAVLTLVVVANAAVVCVRAVRAGGLPTTEVPAQPSRIVEPAGFFPTAQERALLDAERERLAAERAPSGQQ